jgi:hypothetical protein
MENHLHKHPVDQKSNTLLAFEATTHCLLGCGLGDILGFILGTALGITYYSSIALGILLGFVLGLALGLYPLLKANMKFTHSLKIVISTEFFSILTMEAAETIMELIFPGMKKMGLSHIQYWIGLMVTLISGFLAAYPVNLFLVKRGVRHHH